MKIYNNYTRTKETFVPINNDRVGMYVCGPTVYGAPHLGHAKSYINFDIVHRYLNYLGYNVKYVQNITDVGHLVGDADEGEDKIERQARLEQTDAYEIAYRFETMYFDTMDMLNVLRPSISCRATGFIMDMIDYVQTIIDNGYAYVTSRGNVYFDVHKMSEFGILSNRKIDNNISGERISVESDKHNPEDFALWKATDSTHMMKWRSPWGEGCPGWHLECSVLSKKFLGEQFDIHGGGLDNIFPHHECEIAQCRAVSGKNPCNYFIHNHLVTVNGQKMGKSLGNSITLDSLISQYGAEVIRYFIIGYHYRSDIDFNEQSLSIAKKHYNRLNQSVSIMRNKTNAMSMITDERLLSLLSSFTEAMDDDFNTTVATSITLSFPSLISEYMDTDNLSQLNTLINICCEKILGIKFIIDNNDIIPQHIIDMANDRMSAKSNRDYALSDTIRDKILSAGYIITDTRDGYEINKKD